MEVAARLRTSMDGPSRKFSPRQLKLETSPTKFQGVDILRKVPDLDSENPTPRLLDHSSRPPPSVADTASGCLDQSGPTSINMSFRGSKDRGRAYNSFGGLHDMLSMVDPLMAPASPPPPAPVAGGTSSGRLSFASGSFAGNGGKGSAASITAADMKPQRMRSPSRLGSPALSPRSPLYKSSSLGGVSNLAAPLSGPGAKGSRRAQLQALLSKDLAQPHDVVKFKAEVKNLTQPPANVVQLAGDLQEKFDRVNRKLKNWNLIETAATERFNAAMDTALEALFSRINLAWPSGDQPAVASDSSAGQPPNSAYDSLRSGAHRKGGRPEPAQRGQPDKDSDYVLRRSCRYGPPAAATDSSRRTDDADEAGYGSPSSLASQRYDWDEDLSTTTDAEEDTSRGSTRRGGSKSSRTRSGGRARGVAPGQCDDGRGREARSGSMGRGHDADDPLASARTDAEGGRGGRRSHRQVSDVASGIPGQRPASATHAWHVGPNGTYLTGPMQPSQPQPAASAPGPMFGAGFPVPGASAMFGLLQQPFMSSSATYSAPSAAAAGYQVPLSGPKGAGGYPPSAQQYCVAADARHGLPAASAAMGGAKPPDMGTAWKPALGVDVAGGFPFASSGLWTQLYGVSAAPTNPIYGVTSTVSATDSHPASYFAPTASSGRDAPMPSAAAPELCATASTAALHSAGWPAPSAHSRVQVPAAAHGAQESSASGPAPMPAGFDMTDLRGALHSIPYKSAYGYGPGVGGPSVQALAAFAGMGDLMGAIPHMPGGHTVTYGAAGAMGHERHAAGQYFR
ncbi:hypothetical protein PLESTF_001783600 [Pleodorina starrii]|nr:hypothetical protein PLESTF_001783600 [Pleodorina starrii]